MSPLLEQVLCNINGRRLSSVTSVLLEGESQHGNLFVGHRVEHGFDDALTETRFLVLVHINYLAI